MSIIMLREVTGVRDDAFTAAWCQEDRERGITKVTDLDSLGFAGGFFAIFSIKDCPPILVKLEGGNNDIAWVDANGNRRAVRLVPLDAIDVDDPLFTVDLSDLSLATLVLSTDNPDLVILANGY